MVLASEVTTFGLAVARLEVRGNSTLDSLCRHVACLFLRNIRRQGKLDWRFLRFCQANMQLEMFVGERRTRLESNRGGSCWQKLEK